jgi:hypothetical protein
MSRLASLISFFERVMQEHSRVSRCVRLQSTAEDEYVYEITRKGDLPPVRVHVSGAYEYTLGDYVARPKEIKAGDFVVTSSFGGRIEGAARARAQSERIGLGQVQELMGALNYRQVWKYEKKA